jgi:hypothetical protein
MPALPIYLHAFLKLLLRRGQNILTNYCFYLFSLALIFFIPDNLQEILIAETIHLLGRLAPIVPPFFSSKNVNYVYT